MYLAVGRRIGGFCLNKGSEFVKKQKYNLADVREEDFSYELLNQIFIDKIGLKMGMSKMTIGDIDVTKNVSKHYSNTRKSSDYEVRFSWISENGEKKNIANPSIYKENRKSDPERNWGLGRD